MPSLLIGNSVPSWTNLVHDTLMTHGAVLKQGESQHLVVNPRESEQTQDLSPVMVLPALRQVKARSKVYSFRDSRNDIQISS